MTGLSWWGLCPGCGHEHGMYLYEDGRCVLHSAAAAKFHANRVAGKSGTPAGMKPGSTTPRPSPLFAGGGGK